VSKFKCCWKIFREHSDAPNSCDLFRWLLQNRLVCWNRSRALFSPSSSLWFPVNLRTSSVGAGLRHSNLEKQNSQRSNRKNQTTAASEKSNLLFEGEFNRSRSPALSHHKEDYEPWTADQAPALGFVTAWLVECVQRRRETLTAWNEEAAVVEINAEGSSHLFTEDPLWWSSVWCRVRGL